MPQAAISVVVPAFNEAENIQPLIERINRVCTFHDFTYEIIIVDDHSTDETVAVTDSLSKTYPVKKLIKQGKPGKAFSLIEGFSKAKYSIIVMIDADLQYPPENFPHMVRLIKEGKADIVVANRAVREERGVRTLISNGFHYLFSVWLHQMSVDSQSGLKVFRKSILSKVKLNPKPWTFDLDFLTQARDAGYQIMGYDIAFKERLAGKSKVDLLKASVEIGWEAIKLKFRSPVVYAVQARNPDTGFYFKGTKYRHFNKLPLNSTALITLNTTQQLLFGYIVLLLFMGLLVNWQLTLIIIIGLMTYFYFTDVIFNFLLVNRSLDGGQEIGFADKELGALKDADLPVYTIFCPLYKEAHVLPQFVKAMKNMEYPKHKLQVMLLLEQNDKDTIEHAKSLKLPTYIEILIVPHTKPKTKPKACNFGLLKARGDYSVIYDAEDVPDPLQLKKAVLAFKKHDDSVACVQAKLNFYNPEQNLLTRLFTAEYSLWFDLVLPGLQSVGVPIPLGGTSNHFKTDYLRLLQGWDAFNVTEDCDLGIRLSMEGYRTLIIDSITMEEANSQWLNWLNQRTRWLKGYMQTYLVHIRRMVELVASKRISLLAGIQMVVGGKILALLANPFMWALSVIYFSFRSSAGSIIESLFPASIFYFAVAAFVMGNFLYLYYFMLAAAKTGRYRLVKYAFLMPIYWLMISAAAWNALVKLIFEPHYWFKTKHGLHLNGDVSPALSSVLDTQETAIIKE